MASQTYTRLTLVARDPSHDRAANEAIVELLRDRYERALASALPSDTEVTRHARTATDVIDFAALTLRNGGYRDGTATAAAEWVVACCKAWIEALRSDTISGQELAAAMQRAGEQNNDDQEAASSGASESLPGEFP
jgi:hypothetical protein